MHIVQPVFYLTRKSSKAPQASDDDYRAATKRMNSTAGMIDQWRSCLFYDNSEFYGRARRQAEKLLRDYGVVARLACLVKKQTHENNVPVNSPYEYHRVTLGTKLVWPYWQSALRSVQCTIHFASKCWKFDFKVFAWRNVDESNDHNVSEFHNAELPYRETFCIELEERKLHWATMPCKAGMEIRETLTKTLKECYKKISPNIRTYAADFLHDTCYGSHK